LTPSEGPLDLTDRATFLLALDELARRVGLDPTGGVLAHIEDDRTVEECLWRAPVRWRLMLDDGIDQWSTAADTDDPLVALRVALEATVDTRGAGG